MVTAIHTGVYDKIRSCENIIFSKPCYVGHHVSQHVQKGSYPLFDRIIVVLNNAVFYGKQNKYHAFREITHAMAFYPQAENEEYALREQIRWFAYRGNNRAYFFRRKNNIHNVKNNSTLYTNIRTTHLNDLHENRSCFLYNQHIVNGNTARRSLYRRAALKKKNALRKKNNSRC